MAIELTSSKPNIIFIDDEFYVLKTVQRLCKKIDANFHYFNDVESAISWIESNPVHIAISDFNMPKLSGLELLEKVAEKHPESLRILTTGYANETVLRDGINHANLWALIDKPWDNKKLLDTIQSAIDNHNLIRTRLNTQYQWLVEQVSEGQDTERLKNEFLAMMGHEIRTPMTNVIGALNLLHETELDDEQSKLTNHALDEGNSMMSLLSHIITYSKLESGFQSVSVQKVNVIDGLRTTIEKYRERATAKGIGYDITIGDDCQNTMYTDIKIVRQVLSNLLDNAIKFTNAGSILTHIASDTEGLLRVSVKDTGVGIPVDKNTNIFNKFTQVNYSYNRKYEGTGLGLAICKLLINKLGGEINYESHIGRGSEFWFTITDQFAAFDDSSTDRQNERLQLQSPVESYFPTDAEIAALKDQQLLLAEDSQANQLIISSMLKSTGINITIVNDGLEAIEAVKGNDYDIILMDLSMPQMDGAEAAKHIREKLQMHNLPIIALTANTEVYDIKHCLSSGMTDYVFKPVDKSYLVKCLAYYVSKHSLREVDDKVTHVSKVKLSDYINHDAIEQLITDTSVPMMKKITALYFDEMRKRGDTIRSNLDNFSVVGKESHAIKSSSSTIGAAKSAELAKQLDTLCKQKNHQEAEPLIHELLSCMERTETLFQTHLETL